MSFSLESGHVTGKCVLNLKNKIINKIINQKSKILWMLQMNFGNKINNGRKIYYPGNVRRI